MPRSDPRLDDLAPGPGAPRPRRRAVLGLLGSGAVVLAGCSVRAPRRAPPASSPPSTAPGVRSPSAARTAAGSEADESVRQALLSDVDVLQTSVTALGDPGSAGAVVVAVRAALAEQERALTTRADAQRPSSPTDAPAPDGQGDQSDLGALVAALVAAAAAASARVDEPSGPMARLAAAVAAAHTVAADVLSRAASLPGPGRPAADLDAGSLVGTVGDRSGAQPGVRTLVRAREVEAQARYAYGVLAVHLQGDALAAALAVRASHDDAVGVLDAALAGSPEAAPGPRDAYGLPFAVVDDVTAATLAAAVEDGCADAWADVVAALGPGARSEAAGVVTARALQGARWRYRLGRGAELVALPGLSGRT